MKIQAFARTIVAIVIILALWCTTTVTGTTIASLYVRIALTCITLYVCFIHHHIRPTRLFKSICGGLRHAGETITRAVIRFGKAIANIVPKFVGACSEVDFQDIIDKRNLILSNCPMGCCYNGGLNVSGEQTIPIRRIARRIDLFAVFSCIAFSVAGSICVYHLSVIAVIDLFLASLFISYFIGAISNNTTIGFADEYLMATAPCVATFSIIAQVFIVGIEIAITGFCLGDEMEPSVFFSPYFQTKLYILQFSLSPALTIVIICILLALISYGSLCRTLHELVYPRIEN